MLRYSTRLFRTAPNSPQTDSTCTRFNTTCFYTSVFQQNPSLHISFSLQSRSCTTIPRFCTRIYLRQVRQEGAMGYLHDFLSLILFLQTRRPVVLSQMTLKRPKNDRGRFVQKFHRSNDQKTTTCFSANFRSVVFWSFRPKNDHVFFCEFQVGRFLVASTEKRPRVFLRILGCSKRTKNNHALFCELQAVRSERKTTTRFSANFGPLFRL